MPEPTPRTRWVLPTRAGPTAEVLRAGAERGLSRRLLKVLHGRDHTDPAALAALFDDPVDRLHDPRRLPGAAAFAERIGLARLRGEAIAVVGDFDADGLTGLAIMVRALRSLGLDVAPYVPHRIREGHGLSIAAVRAALAQGRTLIVTVDLGASSVAEIAAAHDLGVDVLVTDHHRPPRDLPPAVAIVDPHLPGSAYPDRHLSGSGVAFKSAQLVLASEPDCGRAALDLADLAAVGSVADVVPIDGENRAIVRLGLARLRTAARPGFAALLGRAGVAPERVDVDVIGYSLAPRLNAVGRLGDAAPAAGLLLTDDPAEAGRLAVELDAANVVRRAATATALADARAMVASGPDGRGALVLSGDWPVGIIGLVAGRLAEETGRPCVIVTRAVHPWRASARTAAGLDLAAAFTECAGLLERFGGHPAAAGGDLLPERYDAFRERLLVLSASLPPPAGRPALRLDLLVDARDVDYRLLRDLAPLAAAGEPPALVGISGLVVSRVRSANGGHLQLTLRRGGEVLDGICFGRADELAGSVGEGQAIDLVARVDSRVFGGFESLQLLVRDIAPAGSLAALELAA